MLAIANAQQRFKTAEIARKRVVAGPALPGNSPTA